MQLKILKPLALKLGKIITLAVVALSITFSANAAYLEKIPITVTQPDGEEVHCFATGDEYYNWVHDEKGFTLVPLKVYLKKGRVKIDLGLCKGKKLYDKREDAAEKSLKRDGERYVKERERE